MPVFRHDTCNLKEYSPRKCVKIASKQVQLKTKKLDVVSICSLSGRELAAFYRNVHKGPAVCSRLWLNRLQMLILISRRF